jgi:hypothetical protein
LNRVTLPDEVLAKKIRYVNILVPQIETIQPAVGVLLELRKVGHVILIAIIIKRPEEPRSQIVIREDKTAEIGHKRLDAGAQRDKIKVLVYVFELLFHECFFE